MNWNKIQPAISTSYTGHESRILASGDRLQIRSQPEGGAIETFFDETVPAEKKWKVVIKVTAVEEDE